MDFNQMCKWFDTRLLSFHSDILEVINAICKEFKQKQSVVWKNLTIVNIAFLLEGKHAETQISSLSCSKHSLPVNPKQNFGFTGIRVDARL